MDIVGLDEELQYNASDVCNGLAREAMSSLGPNC